MNKDWNELEFTNRLDFMRMAPSIIQLEISRLGKIIDSLETYSHIHNSLVKGRYALVEFREEIGKNESNKISETELAKLYSALFNISAVAEISDEVIKPEIDYISNRLSDLINKCQMLY